MGEARDKLEQIKEVVETWLPSKSVMSSIEAMEEIMRILGMKYPKEENIGD